MSAPSQIDAPAETNPQFPSVQPDEKSDTEKPWVELDCTPEGYPPLNFKPLVLRSTFLTFVLIFYLTCLIAIIMLLWRNTKRGFIHSSIPASYFAIRYLPTVAGTITILLWRTIRGNFTRMTPYMSMAARQNPQEWRRTLGAPYYAGLGIDWGAGHWLLVAVVVQQIILAQLLPLKSVLLTIAPDPFRNGWETNISHAVAYALIITYSILVCSTFTMMISLWNRPTGLKWDPTSIADQLVLLRGSDILEDFAYLDTQRSKQINELLAGAVYRLGYWQRDGEIRHGIGRGGPRPPRHLSNTSQPPPNMVVHPLLSTPAMIAWTFLAYATAVVVLYGLSPRGVRNGFNVKISQSLANFIFRAFLTFISSAFTLFWNTVDIFHRTTQAFAGMSHSLPQPASENLLLDYISLPPVIVSINAAMKGHWKVAYFSSLALAMNLFPIMVGTVFNTVKTENGVAIRTSLRSLVGTAVFSLVFCISLPFAWPSQTRRLPRNIFSLGDLVSFCYDSKLLTNQDYASVFELNRPSDTKTHLECKVFLKEDKYVFRVRDRGEGHWRAGFDVA